MIRLKNLIICILFIQIGWGQMTGFPTLDSTDAKFLNLTSGASWTTISDSLLSINFTTSAATLTFGIFDADIQTPTWDFTNSGTGQLVTFEILADPNLTGNSSGLTPVIAVTSDDAGAVDNDWYDIFSGAAHSPAAWDPVSGEYRYLITAAVTNSGTADFMNNFKFRGDGAFVILPEKSFLNLNNASYTASDFFIVYPNIDTTTTPWTMDLTGTTNDGHFSIPVTQEIPNWYKMTSFIVWDGDFDHGDGTTTFDTDDPDTPNSIPAFNTSPYAVAEAAHISNPNDDSSWDIHLRPPAIYYTVTSPDGQVFTNDNPSGNSEWEKFEVRANYHPDGCIAGVNADICVDTLVAGVYIVDIYGNDMNNATHLYFADAGDMPLPVELTSFSVENTPDGVLCSWITESEIENIGFFLERRTDGKNWQELASYKTDENLIGQGTTSFPTEYEYIDRYVVPNTSYEYRLADVDYNGIITYHPSRKVRVENVNAENIIGFILLPAYPNPFNPVTTIRYKIPTVNLNEKKNPQVNIAIFDISGKLIVTLVNEVQSSGWHSIEWNGTDVQAEQVPAGVYISKVTYGTEVRTDKLMLLR